GGAPEGAFHPPAAWFRSGGRAVLCPCGHRGVSRSGTLLPGQQGTHFWNQLRGYRHQGHALRFPRGLDPGQLLVLGLVLVVGEHPTHALLLPAGREGLLGHRRSLPRRGITTSRPYSHPSAPTPWGNAPATDTYRGSTTARRTRADTPAPAVSPGQS